MLETLPSSSDSLLPLNTKALPVRYQVQSHFAAPLHLSKAGPRDKSKAMISSAKLSQERARVGGKGDNRMFF